jgi:hypothetical protein
VPGPRAELTTGKRVESGEDATLTEAQQGLFETGKSGLPEGFRYQQELIG